MHHPSRIEEWHDVLGQGDVLLKVLPQTIQLLSETPVGGHLRLPLYGQTIVADPGLVDAWRGERNR